MNRRILTILTVLLVGGCGQEAPTEPQTIPLEAELVHFLTSELTDENLVHVSAVAPRSVDPSRPLTLDTFAMPSGTVLYRAVLTDQNMGHVYVPVLTTGNYDRIEAEVCTLEDSRDLPDSIIGLARLILTPFHPRKGEITRFVECIQAQLETVEEGSGCGVFLQETRNEETGVLDLHATILCPD
ncbi:MAG: hypothetical protein F4107_03915 [Gemmatimonadetes bacterium]|nr:hypothetical protein [Gemmatimonadota bacterium]MYD13377.1 hypothetical protein [Gemmatimonadota bacterium]MYI65074.1 hypothetical protein [Gemmatimonadota bacterium]